MIRVPATTANLGPGFDCLGIALDLWNEFAFEMVPDGRGQSVEIQGFGQDRLPKGDSNLVLQAFNRAFRRLSLDPPSVRVTCRNAFPIGSGLGSSSTAVTAGVLAARALAGGGLDSLDPLESAVELEGHPDNVSAALFGGLTVSYPEDDRTVSIPFEVPDGWWAGVVVPEMEVTTAAMRAALPERILLRDAVFNLGRTALVVQAFLTGDEHLLGSVMSDRLHQPVRLPLMPGAGEALEAARSAGAAGALSGAGPGLIVFSRQVDVVEAGVARMEAVFGGRSIGSWRWIGGISKRGAAEGQPGA